MAQSGGSGKIGPALTIAWRVKQNVHARKLNPGGDLQRYLHDIMQYADGIIEGSRIEEYRPDGGDPEEGTIFSVVRNDRIDAALIEQLSQGADLPVATEAELRKRPLACYALVSGSGAAQRIYVRRQDPVRLASKRLFSGLMGNALTELETVVLTFDDFIDVVIEPERILVLNPKGFESLFRDSDAVLAAAPKWVDELHGHISCSEESQQVLLGSIRRNSVHRRKVLAILDSRHAHRLTPKRVRKRMMKHDLPHEELLIDDTLHFTEENVGTVLKLLNEDLYRGDFSDEHFAASSKQVFRVG